MTESLSSSEPRDLFRGVSGAALCVRDVAAAAAFYRRLGMTTGPITADFTVVVAGASQLYLHTAEPGENAPTQPRGAGMVLQLEVADVDGLYWQALAAQLPIRQPLDLVAWGARAFVVEDPDGYAIAFWQAAAEQAWRPRR